MKRRAVLVFVAIAALGVLAVVVYALLPSGPGVTKANFDRIDDGMSVAQVEALLGPLEADAGVGRGGFSVLTSLLPQGHTRKVWGGVAGAAHVEFDEEHRVAAKVWVDAQNSFFDRVRRWFRRLPI